MRSILLIPLLLTACSSTRDSKVARPADTFFARLSALCGNAYAGTVESDDQADVTFANKPLVIHVRDCGLDEIRIPFHVGEDRSRTWVVSRTGAGLRLKHDHRHRDGTEDALTQYGGDTTAAGTAARQAFPVDQFSKGLFTRENRTVSLTNTWALEIAPGERFVYELSRPNRLFRVRFDLSRTVPAPPPAWGAR